MEDKRERRTQRQEKVLLSLFRHGMMTYEQLATYLNTSYDSVNRIAKRLKDRGELCWCRFANEDTDAATSGPVVPFHVCALTSAGHKRILDTGESRADGATVRSWNGTFKKLSRYDHDREVVDLLIQLNQCFEKHDRMDGLKVRVATSRKKVKLNGTKKLLSSTNVKMDEKKYFLADAIVSTKNPASGVGTTMFLEHERLCEPKKVQKRCKEKLENYLTALKARQHNFIDDQYLILYVVSKSTRVNEIFTSPEAVPLLSILRVGLFEDVIKDPTGPVWRTASLEDNMLRLSKECLING